MDPLDPSVLEATGGPSVGGDQVVSITPDSIDPSYAMVEFADGRTETRPTSEAETLPKVPQAPMGPPMAPAGAGGFVQTQASEFEGIDGAPPPGDPARDAWLQSQGSQGFSPVGRFEPGNSLTPSGPMVYRTGDEFRPAGTPPAALSLPDASGELPAAQPDPNAPIVTAPGTGGPTDPTATTESVGVTTNDTVTDPTQLAQDVPAAYNDIADTLDADAQARQDAAATQNQFELDQANAREQQLADDAHRAQIHTEEAQRVVKVIEDTPIEEDFYKDSPGRQVAAWVALALSGFLSGSTQGANPAMGQMMQALSAAQERFIANQRADKTSKLNKRMAELGDAKTAEASVRMQLGKVFEDRAKLQAKQVGLAELPPAVSTAGAQMRVKAAEASQAIGLHVQRRTDERFTQERRPLPTPAAPTNQAEQQLQSILGPQYAKKHQEATDPKGANLPGLLTGAKRAEQIASRLDQLARNNGGTLPGEGLTGEFGSATSAKIFNNQSSKDVLEARSLKEELKLAFKQSSSTSKFFDGVQEVKGLTDILETSNWETSSKAVRSYVQRAHQGALAVADGVAPGRGEAYLKYLEGASTPRAGAPTPKRSTGFKVPGAAGGEADVLKANEPGSPAAPTTPTAGAAPTGGGPAQPPLAESRHEWRRATQAAASEAGYNPDAMSRIVAFESGGNPKAKNPSGASGLIQFMPDVFDGMTKPPGYENVTHDDLGDLTVEEQMPLVVRYFQEKGLKSDADAGEMYLAVAAPGLLGKPDGQVAYRKGSKAWEQNPSWRPADGGDITAGSIRAKGRSL